MRNFHCQSHKSKIGLLPACGAVVLLLAGVVAAAVAPHGLATYWEYDTAQYRATDSWISMDATGQAEPLEDLALDGQGDFWTAAAQGALVEALNDDNENTVSFVPEHLPNAADLPRDAGIIWPTLQRLSQVHINYYSENHEPTGDGYALQYWNGEAWVQLEDRVAREPHSGAWVHTFDPVATDRIRVLISKITRYPPAIRSFRAFSQPVQRVQRNVRVVLPIVEILHVAAPVGQEHSLAIVAADSIHMLAPNGRLQWEHRLDTPAGCAVAVDFSGNGQAEIVVGTSAGVQCFNERGRKQWATRIGGGDPFSLLAVPEDGGTASVAVFTTAGHVALLADDGSRTDMDWHVPTPFSAVALYECPTTADLQLVIGDPNGVILCRRFADGQVQWQFSTDSGITALAPCGPHIVAGTADGGIIELGEGGKEVQRRAMNGAVIRLDSACMGISDGGSLIAATDDMAGMALWDGTGAVEALQRWPLPAPATTLHIMPGKNGTVHAMIVSGFDDGRVRAYRWIKTKVE